MLLPNMNIPNFPNNNYNCICCNPTYNYPLAMNVPNGFGPNQNMNITGLHTGGNSNWQSIYNTKQQNQNLSKLKISNTFCFVVMIYKYSKTKCNIYDYQRYENHYKH